MFWKASVLSQGQMFLHMLHLCSGLHDKETVPCASGCLHLTRHLPSCWGAGREDKGLLERIFLCIEKTLFQIMVVFSITIHLHFSIMPMGSYLRHFKEVSWPLLWISENLIITQFVSKCFYCPFAMFLSFYSSDL